MWSFFVRDSSKDFPYEIVDQTYNLENRSIWKLHKAKKKGSNDDVSVFIFDIKNNTEYNLEIAKATIKRLKTLRHPSILQYIDSLETEKNLYLATEFVEPFAMHIAGLQIEKRQQDMYKAWGLFQITRALSFLNNDGNLQHNNVSSWSVFINTSGEWKLGGFEYICAVGVVHDKIPIKTCIDLDVYDPPEKAVKYKHSTKSSSDMWGLGCLIWEVYNGPLKNRVNLKDVNCIPRSLRSLYTELISNNPSDRPNPADIIIRCQKTGGYFKNDLIDSLLFLEEIQIKDKADKNKFFSTLTTQIDFFPENVCKYKILPQLITAFEYGEAGSAVLAPMFKLGKLLDADNYQKCIVPCVVRLFASTDRATRSRLLQQLDLFVEHLLPATVNDQIFPQVVNGFLDTNATIREQTVKAIVHLASKLSYNNLNVEVLRHFARLQSRDDQSGIRTNTTVCLGKIAAHLNPQVRQKVLISAFVRATRDPFPPARTAGVLALAATQQYYLLSDVAGRILPALCPLTVDPELSVRDPAFRTLKGFLGKLERVSQDPTLKETMEADVNAATPAVGNAASTWAGWAVTAVTSKFYRSQNDSGRSPNHPNQQLPANSLRKFNLSDEHKGDKGENLPNTTILVTPLENVGKDSSDSTNENWDSTGWDCMENSENTSFSSNNPSVGKLSMTTLPVDAEDGWDTSEWGCIEDEPEIDKKSDDNLNNWSSGKWTEGDSDQTEKHSSDDIIEDNSNISEKRKLQKQRKPACKKEIRGPLKLGQKIQ